MTDCGLSGETAAPGAAGVSLEQLARSSRPALVRVAHAVTGSREEAEDAVQASLLKAMGAWPRVATQEQWRQQAYVRQIVINTCRSGWRKWGSRVLVGDLPELPQASATETSDDRALVRQALARLPARQRDVLMLRYYEDLSEAEIARRLGCAPGTVKSAAARALRALRLMLPEFEARPASLDERPASAAEPAVSLAERPASLAERHVPLAEPPVCLAERELKSA